MLDIHYDIIYRIIAYFNIKSQILYTLLNLRQFPITLNRPKKVFIQVEEDVCIFFTYNEYNLKFELGSYIAEFFVGNYPPTT